MLFIKEGHQYNIIDDCLDLDSKSYMRMTSNDTVKPVVLPNACLMVFETNFDDHDGDDTMDYVRKQLAVISLKVEFHNIYDNKMSIKRDFQWFARYEIEEG